MTEATDLENVLYGKERLSLILNQCKTQTPKEILAMVKSDIDSFVGEAPQFDDITMVCVAYQTERSIYE